MHPRDKENTTFVMDRENFFYEVMPFRLKNVRATHQRLMGRNIEVYVDNRIVKSESCQEHVQDLKEVFDALKSYNLRLNPKKCTLSVEEGKFLGFMLTHREIEANPDNCREIVDMCSLANMKEI